MTPGSNEARSLGCLCDPVRNNYGTGDWSAPGGPDFVIRSCCLVHGSMAWLVPIPATPFRSQIRAMADDQRLTIIPGIGCHRTALDAGQDKEGGKL